MYIIYVYVHSKAKLFKHGRLFQLNVHTNYVEFCEFLVIITSSEDMPVHCQQNLSNINILQWHFSTTSTLYTDDI